MKALTAGALTAASAYYLVGRFGTKKPLLRVGASLALGALVASAVKQAQIGAAIANTVRALDPRVAALRIVGVPLAVMKRAFSAIGFPTPVSPSSVPIRPTPPDVSGADLRAAAEARRLAAYAASGAARTVVGALPGGVFLNAIYPMMRRP